MPARSSLNEPELDRLSGESVGLQQGGSAVLFQSVFPLTWVVWLRYMIGWAAAAAAGRAGPGVPVGCQSRPGGSGPGSGSGGRRGRLARGAAVAGA